MSTSTNEEEDSKAVCHVGQAQDEVEALQISNDLLARDCSGKRHSAVKKSSTKHDE